MTSWTAWDDARAEAVADSLVRDVLSKILAEWQAALDGVWIVGGYGRGEGSLIQGPAGQFRPWNDLDVMLLLQPGRSAPPGGAELAAAWAGEAGLDSIDMGWVPAGSWKRPRSLFHLEARQGHRVVWGSGDAARALPESLTASERRAEARRLLVNRGYAVLLVAADPAVREATSGGSFALNALLKCDMALGDARLLLAGRLPLRYAERPAALAGLGAPAELLRWHAAAVEHKLRPTQAWAGGARDLDAALREGARRWLSHGPDSAGVAAAGGGRTWRSGLRDVFRSAVRARSGRAPDAGSVADALPALMRGLAESGGPGPEWAESAAPCLRAWRSLK